ncbi:MAG: 50S ribosomal protein L35 [Deltaproteobacteria bacterium]|nr:50S ribosomal protein L35 [Deltaproteobacteria bacterium]
MPKLKTNKGAAKRFKITASGKVKRRKAGMRHLLTAKSKGSKRSLGKAAYVEKTDADAIKKMMPYG